MKGYQNVLRSLWDGVCDVYVRSRDTVDKDTGRNIATETKVVDAAPCRLSFSTIATTSESSDAALIVQTTKLFISKEVDIPEGSKIVVTQEGDTSTYRRTGKPAIYSTHQEVMLDVWKGWA